MKTKACLISAAAFATALTLNAAEPVQADPASAAPQPAADPCLKLPAQVQARIKEDASKLTEIVADLVTQNPACACEIVKAAIDASKADAKTVAAIVEAAINAAPEHMRLIAQCAIAAAPDALAEVQAVLARLDPNRGESAESSKSAKSAKIPAPQGEVAQMPNPLDFPGMGPAGPTPGGPGGFPLIPVVPPIINPPNVTNVDP